MAGSPVRMTSPRMPARPGQTTRMSAVVSRRAEVTWSWSSSKNSTALTNCEAKGWLPSTPSAPKLSAASSTSL
jgi:hypothetical protein